MADTFKNGVEAANWLVEHLVDAVGGGIYGGCEIDDVREAEEVLIRALTPPPASGDREALEEILDNPKYVSFYMRREDRGRLADAILAAGFKRGR